MGEFSWNMLKGRFSRTIDEGERISKSRQKRREQGIWQRRFCAHLVQNQEDYNRHVDYIHWNPVKHGNNKHVIDWPYSSFHGYMAQVFMIQIGEKMEYLNLKMWSNLTDASFQGETN